MSCRAATRGFWPACSGHMWSYFHGTGSKKEGVGKKRHFVLVAETYYPSFLYPFQPYILLARSLCATRLLLDGALETPRFVNLAFSQTRCIHRFTN